MQAVSDTKINGRWWHDVPPNDANRGDRVVFFDRGYRTALVADRRRRTVKTCDSKIDGIKIAGRSVKIEAITRCLRRGRT